MLETKGLPNCGGTCYFNSCMQFLFNIQEIQNFFKKYTIIDSNTILNEEEKKLILILNDLKNIYNIIIRSNDSILSTIDYNKLIKETLDKILDRGDIVNPLSSQEDSSEIIVKINNKFIINTNTDILHQFENNYINTFSKLLKKYLYNYTLSIRLYNKKTTNCKYDYKLKKEEIGTIQIKTENLHLDSKLTNFIDTTFKIHVEELEEGYCVGADDRPLIINGQKILLNEFKVYYTYELQSKYIIINFIPYTYNTRTNIIDYGQIEIDKIFSVNNINYEIKGIVIHTGKTMNSGHYYYLHFKNDECTEYNDSRVSRKNLTIRNNKYIFDTNNQPVIIIYEKKDNINPSKKINYDFTSFIEQKNSEIVNQPIIQQPIIQEQEINVRQQKYFIIDHLLNPYINIVYDTFENKDLYEYYIPYNNNLFNITISFDDQNSYDIYIDHQLQSKIDNYTVKDYINNITINKQPNIEELNSNIDQLKKLIDSHFTKLNNLKKILEK
jgi:hypothetical protein